MTRADEMGMAMTFKGLMNAAHALIQDHRDAEAKEVEAMALRLREIAYNGADVKEVVAT